MMFANIPRKIMLFGLVMFAALVWAGTTSTVSADPTCLDKPADNESDIAHCANTLAVVGPLTPPVIENSFLLPQMNPDKPTVGAAAGDKQLMSYINPADKTLPEASHRHDDGVNGKALPGRQMEVRPNIDDKPDKRVIEQWAFVSSELGISDISEVHVRIYDSTVTKDDAVADAALPVSLLSKVELKLRPRSCADVGSPTDEQSPIHAALWTGQTALSKDPAEPNAAAAAHVHNLCDKLTLTAWSGQFNLNKLQPEGKYLTLMTATGFAGGKTAIHQQGFLVQNVLAFKMDFIKVDWGTIVPATKDIVPGDTIFATGSDFPSAFPTVESTGNSPACLSVTFSKMVGKNQATDTTIQEFDATFLGQTIFFDAGVAQQFTGALGPNVPTQIDFSIQPPTPLAADTYQGQVDLVIKKANTTTCVPPPTDG